MIVTSARIVEKSPSMMTRFILPWGGEWVIEGGVNSERRISLDTGRLVALTRADTHLFMAVCLVSHSFPLLHFIR